MKNLKNKYSVEQKIDFFFGEDLVSRFCYEQKKCASYTTSNKKFQLSAEKPFFKQNFQLSFFVHLSLYARATVNFIKIKRYFISILNFVKLFHKLYLISAATGLFRCKWLLEVVAASCFAVSVLFLLQVFCCK